MRPISRALVCLALASSSLSGVVAAAVAASGAVTLHWTAPGDDSLAGRATLYDLRYSTAPITAANFLGSTAVTGVPSPKTAGSAETFIVPNLVAGSTYYFAIKTGDEIPNWSLISNSSLGTALATTGRPEPATFPLALSSPWPNPARGLASWSYSLPQEGRLDIAAFDLAGRHVRNVVRGVRAAGQGRVDWDLRDDTGQPVPAGVYLIRATIGGKTVLKTLAVTR